MCAVRATALTWDDIDWARNRMRVTSPKTAHHKGKAHRWIPIFPELLPPLREVFEQAAPGTIHVITRYRHPSTNLRTQLRRILAKAGLEPWPKALAELACQSRDGAMRKFRTPCCRGLERASAKPTDRTQNRTQQAAAAVRNDGKANSFAAGIAQVFPAFPINACHLVGDEGLEPPTSTV